jgi:hypothetical protein
MGGVDPSRSSTAAERKITLRAVTVIMTAVVGLTFLFGFGNVWTLALRLGVPPWVAPLVAPAVDLSVMGLLLGTRYLALHGAQPELLRPARRLLVLSSLMTLALNVTDPLLSDQFGKAAFDAVGPLLLIGWAEVGPGLLQAISNTSPGQTRPPAEEAQPLSGDGALWHSQVDKSLQDDRKPLLEGDLKQDEDAEAPDEDLLERAREENIRHMQEYQRPISAETLRKRLRVGAGRSRMLVTIVRSEERARSKVDERKSSEGIGRPRSSAVSY